MKGTCAGHTHTQRPFCVGQLLLGWGPDLECVDVPGDTALKKIDFSFFQKVSIASSFLARVGALWILPLFRAEILFDLNLVCFFAGCHRLWVRTCVRPVLSGRCCLPGVPTITTSFCLLFLTEPWALTGRNAIDKDIPISTEHSKVSHALYVVGDLFVNHRLLQEEASDKG